MSLTKFKTDYIENILQFLWGQWSKLGVYGATIPKGNKIIDPEALLLFTLDFGRFDPRLFDEVIDWLLKNGEWINVRRLRTLVRKYPGFPNRVLSVISEILCINGQANKWKFLVKDKEGYKEEEIEGLFYTKDNKELPVVGNKEEVFLQFGLSRGKLGLRGMSSDVPMSPIANMVFKLRSLFGINSRAEIIAYLLTHGEATPSKVSKDTYFSQRGINEAMTDLANSGLVMSRTDGREKPYRLTDKSQWLKLLGYSGLTEIQWVNWLLVFTSLSVICNEISQPELEVESPYIQSSGLRRLMRQIRKDLDASSVPFKLSDDTAYPGEIYLKRFFDDIDAVTKTIGFEFPDGRKIPLENWDSLRPMERDMVRKHPYHIADVEVLIQSLENKLSEDGSILASDSPKWGSIEKIRRGAIHLLIWRLLRDLKAIVYLCMDDLSQSTFLVCRQVLEEYIDLHQLCIRDGESEQRALGFFIGSYKLFIKGIDELRKEYRGTKIVEPELKGNLSILKVELEELLSALSSPKERGTILNEWPLSVFKRLKRSRLWQEFGLIYQYLSLKSHSSYFDVVSRVKLPKIYIDQVRFEIEEDISEKVIGFAYELVYRGFIEYFAFMQVEKKEYNHPSEILSEMERVFEFVNQKSLRLYIKRDFGLMRVSGVNLLI